MVNASRESASPAAPKRSAVGFSSGRSKMVELIWPGKSELADRELLHEVGGHIQQGLEQVACFGQQPGFNSLIIGDNRLAMSALLDGSPESVTAYGSVKLCYIDPPYNTGANFSTYGDSRSSAEWLDHFRDRLVQIRALLAVDGSVWVHLDDSEQHRARVVLDEVFGAAAFVTTVIWQKRTSRDNRTAFSSSHDYIHVYAPLGAKAWKKIRNGLPDTGTFANPDSDPRGPWRSTPMSAQAGHGTAAQFYTLTTPTGVRHEPPPGRCWTYSAARLAQLDKEGRVYWPRQGDGKPRLKRYASEAVGLAPSTIWAADQVGDTAEAKKLLMREFNNEPVFDTPKPERLLEQIISIASDPGDVVLDSYLGSGTTAVAAARLGRRFIGIESSEEVVNKVVEPRLRQVVDAIGSGYATYRVTAPFQ